MDVKLRIRRRLFRNPVVTAGGAIVADVERRHSSWGRVWVATLRPYAGNQGPDHCPMGVVTGISRKHLRTLLEHRINVRGEWWT